MAQIGWKPIGPDAYRDVHGDIWSIGSTNNTDHGTNHNAGNRKMFIKEVRRSASAQLWAHASQHYGGTGLALGGDLYAAQHLRNTLLDAGLMNEVGILEAMVCGAL